MESKILIIITLLCFIYTSGSMAFGPDILCGTEEPITTTLSDIDTIRAVVLFTAGSFWQELEGLPEMRSWMYDVWDINLENSIPHFFETSSYGKFKMTGDSYPIGDTAFLTDLAWGSFYNDSAHNAYMLDIYPKADSAIDFGLYDNRGPNGSPNPDGYVDYFVFVTLTASVVGRNLYGFDIYSPYDPTKPPGSFIPQSSP
jgi:hypothetical protein